MPTTKTLGALVADRSNPQVLYTASKDGLFKTTDAGQSWQAVDRGVVGTPIVALAIDPRDSRILFAASIQGAIFETTDGRGSWRRQN